MSYDIRIEEHLPMSPDQVWRALTDSAIIAEWLMPNDFQPKIGHKFQFRSKPMPGWRGFVDCKVIEVVRPKVLAYTWLGDDDWTEPTIVRFTLTPEGDGTHLLFEHTGFQDPWGAKVSEMLGQGWPGMIRKRLHAAIQAVHTK